MEMALNPPENDANLFFAQRIRAAVGFQAPGDVPAKRRWHAGYLFCELEQARNIVFAGHPVRIWLGACDRAIVSCGHRWVRLWHSLAADPASRSRGARVRWAQ